MLDDQFLAASQAQIAELDQRVGRGSAEPPSPETGPFRRAVRALVLRLLRPYTAHQTNINNDIVAALEGLTQAVRQVAEGGKPQPDAATLPASDATRLGLDEVLPIHPDDSFLIPPRQLWVMDDISWWDFFRWPAEYRAYLTLLCNLRRDSCVLEIGCQSGRTMLGLHGYLQPPGRYEGLDISHEHVNYAQNAIHEHAPLFNFTALDIHHSWYNPSGRLDPAAAPFPYDDKAFDVAYAASVFTHLLPDATENYLRETSRVMRPGGRFLFSYFDLDRHDSARSAGSVPWLDISQRLSAYPGVGVASAEHPDQLVGYRPELLETLAQNAGLNVERMLPGYWSNTEPWAVNEQELMVLTKP